MILISVDLPAPFSPISACTSPALDTEIDVVERADAGIGLARRRPSRFVQVKIRQAGRRRCGEIDVPLPPSL